MNATPRSVSGPREEMWGDSKNRSDCFETLGVHEESLSDSHSLTVLLWLQ
jgi:hypothetical protein